MLLLAYPTFIAVKARNLPWIYDITTDPIDPPRYDTLAKARPRDANPIVYAGLTAAELQLEAYPDIEPLDADIDTRSAYNAALTIINRRRWRVVERALRIRAGRRAASKRWRERRSWDSATTSSCGCGRSKAARASTSAHRRATARSISAPTPRASAP